MSGSKRKAAALSAAVTTLAVVVGPDSDVMAKPPVHDHHTPLHGVTPAGLSALSHSHCGSGRVHGSTSPGSKWGLSPCNHLVSLLKSPDFETLTGQYSCMYSFLGDVQYT